MKIQESVPLAGKTTMRIGGNARYFADLHTKEDVEEAWKFAKEKGIPLIPLGSGSNTIFADGEINALVVRMAADTVNEQRTTNNEQRITVQAGKNLAMLINELAAQGLDLSPLTGIPGTVGGALFGNAGQGPNGIWIDSFVERVTAFRNGAWEELTRKQCDFGYRESVFKHDSNAGWILWETDLVIPRRDPQEIQADIETLLQKRIATQPHRKTAGSVFKAHGETPAWKLIDAAGLRGLTIGGVRITEQHANFLENTGEGTFRDAVSIIERVRSTIPEPLDVEMRFYGEEGRLVY